jgi:hypothetical protein
MTPKSNGMLTESLPEKLDLWAREKTLSTSRRMKRSGENGLALCENILCD